MALNSMETQVTKLPLALGAVVEGAYLYAGADKGIESEMQGKDNGDTIYYKTTDLGTPEMVNLSLEDETKENISTSTAIKQTVVPVTMSDVKVMYTVRAFEKQVTSIGEDLAYAKVGQKLAKTAVKKVIADDISNIGNVFVASDDDAFSAFQSAGAYMKSIVDGTLYGFMDWQVWGNLTGKGQQAVPCALAESRFGKNLVGSWTLIDQLRVIPDISVIVGKAIADGTTVTITEEGSVTASEDLPAGAMFTVAGVYAKDVNDMATPKLFTFVTKKAITAGTVFDEEYSNAVFGQTSSYTSTAKRCNFVIPEGGVSAVAVTSVLTANKHYAGTIIRADGAQVFGTMKTCDCEGAKYEKSSIDGINIHINAGENINGLKTDKRFDMILASKLVEPRAACVVWFQLDK